MRTFIEILVFVHENCKLWTIFFFIRWPWGLDLWSDVISVACLQKDSVYTTFLWKNHDSTPASFRYIFQIAFGLFDLDLWPWLFDLHESILPNRQLIDNLSWQLELRDFWKIAIITPKIELAVWSWLWVKVTHTYSSTTALYMLSVDQVSWLWCL